MKTLFAAAIALSLVTGAAASAHAEKYPHGQHAPQEHGRKDGHHNDRHDDHHNDHRNDHWDNDHRNGGKHHEVHADFRNWNPWGYRAGYAQGRKDQRRYDRGRYIRPHGYYHHVWRYGERLPRAYYATRYIVHDYHVYGLRTPPRGYHWVRVNNDVLLAAITTGVVVSVVNSLFH